jgi:hypothetical protein
MDLNKGATVTSLVALQNGSVNIADMSKFTLIQTLGQMEGLAIDFLNIDVTSLIDIQFDSADSAGLDWGLRWTGDKQTELQNYLDAGLLTFSGGTEPISVFYDSANYGDFTYLGYLGTASVPEPSSLMLFGITALFAARRRRVNL